jgi:hypothetical protein
VARRTPPGGRGTVLERDVLGAAPGPGVSLFAAAVALLAFVFNTVTVATVVSALADG